MDYFVKKKRCFKAVCCLLTITFFTTCLPLNLSAAPEMDNTNPDTVLTESVNNILVTTPETEAIDSNIVTENSYRQETITSPAISLPQNDLILQNNSPTEDIYTPASTFVSPMQMNSAYTFNHRFDNITSQSGQWYTSSHAAFYTCTVTAEQQFNVEMSSADFDSYLVLRKSNGDYIKSDNNSAGEGNARIETVINTPGTYIIEATQYYRAEGNYTLKSNIELTPTAATAYQNQNPPIYTFNHQFKNILSQNGQWYTSSHAAFYTFTVAAGHQFNVEMSSANFDSYLVLRKSNGDCIKYDNNSAGSGNARIETVINTPGTYTLEATQYYRAEGNYTLKSNLQLTPTATTAYQNQNPPIYTFNHRFDNATSQNGQWYSSCYADYYTFTAVAGQQLNIEMSSANFDSYLVLRKSNGDYIKYDNNSAGSGNARIETVINTPGTYTLEATQYHRAEGNYTLNSNVQWFSEDGAAMTPVYSDNTPNASVEISAPQQKQEFTGANTRDIKADQVETMPDGKKKYSGNVKINDYLKLDGTLLVDSNNLEITGNGVLYIETTAPYFHGQINLFSGNFTLNTETGELLKQSGLDKLEVAGMKVEISSLRLMLNGVKIAGNLKLPANVGGASVNVDNLQIINGKIDFGGQIKLPTLKLGKSTMGLKDAYMEFNTQENIFVGHAILEIPKVCGIEGKVGFKNARLNEVGFGLDGTNIAIDASGFFITRLYGEVGGITEPPLKITGISDISGGPKLGTICAIEGKGLALTVDMNGNISGSGNLNLFSYQLSSGKFSIDNVKGFYVKASLSALDIIKGNAEIAINKQLNFQGSAIASLQIPENVMFIGGKKINEVAMNLNNTGMRAGIQLGMASLQFWANWDGQWGFDGNLDFKSAKQIKSADYRIMELGNYITIPNQMPQAIIRLTWEGESTDFSLTGPNGESITPQNAPLDSLIANYFSNPSQNEAFYILANPSAGNWYYTLSNPATTNYNIEIYQVRPTPGINLTSPSTDIVTTNTVDINWETDASSDYILDLYYSEQSSGNIGTLIASGLNPALKTYSWDITSVSSGKYYIFACLDDGQNSLIYTYAPGRVIVDNPQAPLTPSNFGVNAINGYLHMNWTDNSEADLAGYKLYLKGLDEQQLIIGKENSFEWYGLSTGQTYTLSISAINEQGLESLPTAPVEVYLPVPTPPVIQINWPPAISKQSPVEITGEIETGATATLFQNNEVIATGLNGQFQQSLVLEYGFNQLKIIAAKANGDAVEQTSQCYYDPTPPQLTVNDLYQNMQTDKSPLIVSGTAEPASTLTLNGNQIIVQEDGSFASSLTLNPGYNQIILMATDEAGNSTLFLSNVQYTADPNAPVLSNVTTSPVIIGETIFVTSNQDGCIYLVPDNTPLNKESIKTASTSLNGTKVNGQKDVPASLNTTGFAAGDYMVYAINTSGSISAGVKITLLSQISLTATDNTVTVNNDMVSISPSDPSWVINVNGTTFKNTLTNTDIQIENLPQGLSYSVTKGSEHSIIITISSQADMAINTPLNLQLLVKGSAFNEAGTNDTPPVTVSIQSEEGNCFIATAAFGSYLDPHVWILRQFRDNVLLKYSLGKWFVAEYYKHSPPIAAVIAQHSSLKITTRILLTPIILGIQYTQASITTIVLLILLIVFITRRRKIQ